jgi:hypothetical protein
MRVQLAPVGGRLRIVAVQLQRHDGITADDLQSVHVSGIEAFFASLIDMVRTGEGEELSGQQRTEMMESLIEAFAGAEDGRELGGLKVPTKRELRLGIPNARRYPDGFYEKVARLYLALVANGRRPAPALADANRVPVTTVHRWIKEARARRFLPPARKAGATG